MKNRFFADKRDYFKWDFLEDLLDRCPELQTFTNIVMLTEDDETNQGQHTKYKREDRRTNLYKYLQSCLNSRERCVTKMRAYFQNRPFVYYPYRDDSFYTYESRKEYFCNIDRQQLQRALVFFDPDIGLQTGTITYMKGKNGKGLDRYLFNESLSLVSQKTPDDSIIVVYQHLQWNRTRRRDDARERCDRFRIIVGSPSAVFVTDWDIAFLATSRNLSVYEKLKATVMKHSERHGLEWDELTSC